MSEELERIKFLKKLYKKSEKPAPRYIDLQKESRGCLNEKELRAMGQLVSGYLDFAERQAERGQVMTMKDWAEHLDSIP